MSLQMSSLPPFSLYSPTLYILGMMSCGMEYPFVQWGSAVPAMSPPRSLSTPILLTGGAVQEVKKGLDSMQLLLSSNKMF